MLGWSFRVSGQRLVGSGAVGLPSRSLPPSSLPQEVARAPPSRCTVGGAWVGGPSSAGGGVPRQCPPPAPSRPSPASSLVWRLGLRRWLVPLAVAPVGEGVAQSPGEPIVGVRICDAEHRPPLQEGRPRRLFVGPCRPNQCPEDPLVVLLGRPPPLGVPAGSPRPSGRARHRRAGSSPPWWSASRPSSAKGTPPPPGGGPQPPGGPGPCPSPGPRAGPPLPLAPAPPAAPVPAARAPRPAPPPPRQRPSAPAPPSARGWLAGAWVGGVGGG